MVREPRVVFSASVHDKWLIRDLLHAELFLNKTLQRQLHGLGRYIDKLLSYHRKGSVKLDPSRLGDSQFFYEAKLALEGWPRYLQVETLLHYLPGKRGNFYFSELCQLIGLDPATISDTQERMLAEEALPEVEKRLGTIQIRLVPRKEKLKPDTLVNRRIPHQYVVFEVFPVKPEWITVESDRKTLFTDEIPF